MKPNDIYHIRYTQSFRDNNPRGDLNHCFEGLAIALEVLGGGLMLFDTFWGIGNTSGKSWIQEDVDKNISIEFYCNLDEIEHIQDWEQMYYADQDLFRLTRQHACSKNCISYYKRKGAERSRDKMKASIESKAADAVRRIQFATADYDRYTKSFADLENSTDLNTFYI